MKPVVWLIFGFCLTGLAKMIEGMGDAGADPAQRLPFYIPALVVLVAGQFCLFRGLRGVIVGLWSGAFDRRRDKPPADPRPARRMAGNYGEATSDSDFDADEVFARYLERQQAEAAAPPGDTPPPPARRPAGSSSQRQTPVRTGFGRRVV